MKKFTLQKDLAQMQNQVKEANQKYDSVIFKQNQKKNQIKYLKLQLFKIKIDRNNFDDQIKKLNYYINTSEVYKIEKQLQKQLKDLNVIIEEKQNGNVLNSVNYKNHLQEQTELSKMVEDLQISYQIQIKDLKIENDRILQKVDILNYEKENLHKKLKQMENISPLDENLDSFEYNCSASAVWKHIKKEQKAQIFKSHMYINKMIKKKEKKEDILMIFQQIIINLINNSIAFDDVLKKLPQKQEIQIFELIQTLKEYPFEIEDLNSRIKVSVYLILENIKLEKDKVLNSLSKCKYHELQQSLKEYIGDIFVPSQQVEDSLFSKLLNIITQNAQIIIDEMKSLFFRRGFVLFSNFVLKEIFNKLEINLSKKEINYIIFKVFEQNPQNLTDQFNFFFQIFANQQFQLEFLNNKQQ